MDPSLAPTQNNSMVASQEPHDQQEHNSQEQMQMIANAIARMDLQIQQLATSQASTEAILVDQEQERHKVQTFEASKLTERERRQLQITYMYVLKQVEIGNKNYTPRDLRDIRSFQTISRLWAGSWAITDSAAAREIQRQWFLFHLVARRGWPVAAYYMEHTYDAAAQDLPELDLEGLPELLQPRIWSKSAANNKQTKPAAKKPKAKPRSASKAAKTSTT